MSIRDQIHALEDLTTPELAARYVDLLGRPRAAELTREVEETEPTVEDMRRRHGGAGVSDEEMILRWLFGDDDVAALRRSAPPTDYPSARRPLVSLIEALAKRTDCSRIQVSKPGLSLTLEKRAGAE